MLLRRHNLNLLPILRELLRTQSVSRTAESVGLSQSTVSAALARLRETFGDELLVMVGRKLELTERARQLVERTERAYEEAEALLQPRRFDPKEETRRFVVATSDYATLLIAPRLVRMMSEAAPKASVHFMDLGATIEAELTRGAVDVAAVPGNALENWTATFSSAALFQDEAVVIASREHRPFKGPLTKAVYEKSRHAMFQVSPRIDITFPSLVFRTPKSVHGNVVTVQQFLTLPAIVEQTDCLAMCQRRLAEHFSRTHAIELFDPPFETKTIFVRGYWSRNSERDPAHAWFRGLLAEAAAGSPVRDTHRASR